MDFELHPTIALRPHSFSALVSPGELFIEHDPMIYEDAQEMAWYLSMATKEAANNAAALPYAPGIDPFFGDQ